MKLEHSEPVSFTLQNTIKQNTRKRKSIITHSTEDTLPISRRQMKFKKPAKIFLIGFFFLMLITASELIFTFKNRPEYIYKSLSYLIIKTRENKLNNISYLLIDLTTNFSIKRKDEYYSKIIPEDKSLTYILLNNRLFSSEVDKIIQDRLTKIKEINDSPPFSNIYYHTGLLLYEKGYIDESIPFFLKSIYSHPEISFMYVELANVFFNSSRMNEGVEILEFCKKFKYPKRHCGDYLENNVKSGNFEKVGSMRDITNEYQGFK